MAQMFAQNFRQTSLNHAGKILAPARD